MHDHPLSRLLMKAKLLRRSSSSSIPQAVNKAGTGSGSATRANSNSHSSSGLPPHHLSPDETDAKPRAYSTVSALSVDNPSSPEEIAGPATGSSADQGRHSYFGQLDHGSAPKLDEHHDKEKRAQRPRPVDSGPSSISRSEKRQSIRKSSDGNCDRALELPSDHPQFANSPPQTPLTNELHLSSLAATPSTPGTADQSVGVPTAPSTSFQSRIPVDPQLTPSLDAVAEYRHPTEPTPSFPIKRPSLQARQQSLLPPSQNHLVSGLVDPGLLNGRPGSSRLTTEMIPTRKIWVKRPGGSATLVPILEDALVDELRDQVIMKYANSLGRNFDSPDIVIRIAPREGNRQSIVDRMLSPEESLVAVLDKYYPGGQTVEEALVIDSPSRRTPKPSPRHAVYHTHSEPGEHGEYFPLMPVNAPTPPSHSISSPVNSNAAHSAPSISILATGKAPPLPSPGSRASGRHNRRPALARHPTGSPTLLGQVQGSKESVATPNSQPTPPAPSVPSPPPAPAEPPQANSHTPAGSAGSPHQRPPLKTKKPNNSQSHGSGAFAGLIDGTVPPINVLIVEDNIINQKLLEAFMKRLKVRWKCAANGEEAVNKWRQGGFHLVLMDIQLPVMNGLEATKEIRRLERLNGIGVFPKTASGRSSAASGSTTLSPGSAPENPAALKEEDTLQDLSLFKSPVIIVALTASSLQSDRHEALAAGCNDFLTKPVGFPWLEQKVTEWGCMQALIDFEGWRKWRGFVDESQAPSPVSDGAGAMKANSNEIPEKPLPAPAHPVDSDGVQAKKESDSPDDSPNLPTEADIIPREIPDNDSTLDAPASPTTPAISGQPAGEAPNIG